MYKWASCEDIVVIGCTTNTLVHACVGRGEEEGLKPADLVKLSRTKHMSWRERLRRTCALWPYMVPLTVVFFSEYSMQVTSCWDQ